MARRSKRRAAMGRRAVTTATDNDVHTAWRHLMTSYNRAGAAAKDKRLTRRRERREGAREVERERREP